MATIAHAKRSLPLRSTPVTVGLCLLLAIAAFFLWQEHRVHVLGILPYLLLAACPLIHLFMHGRHGGHRGHDAPHDHHDGGDEGAES
jgi:hypothetical protein